MHTLSTLVIATAALGAAGCQNQRAQDRASSATAPAPTRPAASAPRPLDAGVHPVAVAPDARPAIAIPTGLPAFPARGGRGADPIGEEQPRYLLDYGYSEQMGWLRAHDDLLADNVADSVAKVKAKPGSPRARMWLARVVGDERFAIEQLGPLAEATDCDHCADVIRNLKLQAWPPAVAALAERVRPSKQRAAAEAILQAMGTNDAAAMARYLGRGRVAVATNGTNCDEDCVNTTVTTGGEVAARLAHRFDEKVDEINLVSNDELFCRRDCCEMPEAMMMGHSSLYLRGFCFAPGTDEVVEVLLDAG
jgi:hypothetical protein